MSETVKCLHTGDAPTDSVTGRPPCQRPKDHDGLCSQWEVGAPEPPEDAPSCGHCFHPVSHYAWCTNPTPATPAGGQPAPDDELLARMRRMFEATLWAYTDLEPGPRKAVAEHLCGDMVGDGVDPGLLDEYRLAEARSHGEVLAEARRLALNVVVEPGGDKDYERAVNRLVDLLVVRADQEAGDE